MNQIVISFIGPDRPGLVDKISNIIKSHQGNWQISSLHHMSSFFAGVVQVSIAAVNTDVVIEELKAIENLESIIKIKENDENQSQGMLVLELTANDRFGIIQEISSAIHQQGGNLLKLVSTHESAAHSGLDLFKAKVSICIADADEDALIEAIENLADDIMVDISR